MAGLNKAEPSEKDHPKFEMAPAASYSSHQTSEKVTIGASVYDTVEKARAAFGKLNPYQYGIVPVLVVIQNDSGQTLRMDRIRVDYVAPDGSHVDATPAQDVRYLNGTRQPGCLGDRWAGFFSEDDPGRRIRWGIFLLPDGPSPRLTSVRHWSRRSLLPA